MNRYQMKINLLSPVCIAQKRGVGNVIETLDYIPGSTLRGAMAMRYIQQQGTDPDFYRIFTSERTRFGNCYLEGAMVIPFTATACKYSGEFSKQPLDAKIHGVLDTLIPLAEYELIGKNHPCGKIEDKFETCQRKKEDGKRCNAIMDRFSRYYQQTGPTIFRRIKPAKRLIARTAVMDSLETALPGNLYTLEVLNENQRFSGWLETDEPTFKRLKEVLGDAPIRIGAAKSRALGEIKIELLLPAPQEGRWLVKETAKRLEGLNAEMQKGMAQKYSQPPFDVHPDVQRFKQSYFFSVTLHTDMLLLDEILRFKSTLEIQDLIEALPSPTQEQQFILKKFQLLRGWLSTLAVTGWNIALKLPKEDEVAISKGSVFLFVTKPGETISESEVTPLSDLLEQIELSEIGERRNEGFGKVRICDEFHWGVPYK